MVLLRVHLTDRWVRLKFRFYKDLLGGYQDNWGPYPHGGWNQGMGDGFGHYGGQQSYGGGPMRGPPGGGYQRNQPYGGNYNRR